MAKQHRNGTIVLELLMDVVKIRGKKQSYDWGDVSYIPQLLKEKPNGKRYAELWFGTHPGGEAVIIGPKEEPLGTFLSRHAQTFYGESHLKRYGPVLPFLLKVLAIDKPLSLQVHPSGEQARAGYQAELPLHDRIPREQWNYKDDRQKAEVLYALTPVTAMCGFRPIAQIVENLQRVIPHRFSTAFPFFRRRDADGEDILLREFFTTLYTMDNTQRILLLKELSASLKRDSASSWTTDGAFLTAEGIARACMEDYPEDPGLFAPFFLNIMHVQPGQAIYLEPGTIHAYVKGHGIELMNNSDNVLRAGLTHKKVDIPELIAILSFKVVHPVYCPQKIDPCGRVDVLTHSKDFSLGVYRQGSYAVQNRHAVELLFCTSDSSELTTRNEVHTLLQGECVVVAAAVDSYRLEVEHTVFSASLPR